MFYINLEYFWICILLYLVIVVRTDCPAEEDIYPCSCVIHNHKKLNIVCAVIESQGILEKAIHGLRNTPRITSFSIYKSQLMYLPHDIFKSIQIENLILRSTSFMALTDSDTAFGGIEESLTDLRMIDCQMFTDWDWSVLKKFKNLKSMRIEVEMKAVSENIKQVAAFNLERIVLNNNKIHAINKEAFAAFENIKEIELGNNLISVVKRSMMPRPAKFLRILSLSKNEIQHIPEDMFDEMPGLLFLDLDSNKLITLNEKTFSILPQLIELNAKDNPLTCDCRLSWLTNEKFHYNVLGVCKHPSSLKGKSLKDIKSEYLWC